MPENYQFDYTNQAWLKDGRYVRCGHQECARQMFSAPLWIPVDQLAQVCCFGTRHEGERPNLTAEVR